MPVGNTDFQEIRRIGLYYIDKTKLIDQLLGKSRAIVTLFTRPRRFGKSLNMSMLQHFFDCREKSKDYYHAFLTGLLSGRKGVIVKSNDENSRGRTDIVVKNKAEHIAVVIETKRAKTEEEMEALSKEALKQINQKKYYAPFKNEKVIKYGIAFWGKECLVSRGGSDYVDIPI